MGFFELAESGLVYALIGAGLLFVLGFTVLFMRRSWVRAKEIGYTTQQLSSVVKASIASSVVPSIAIIIGFFAMTALLGVAWPWWRLSVLGSVTYELTAADMALKSAGVESVADASATDFTLVMFVMTICILGGIISSLFISKKIQTGTMNLKKKDARWGALGGSTFMLTIMAVFTVPMILTGGVTLLTWATSLVLAFVFGAIVKATKAAWLTNFVQAICLLLAMGSSVLWTSLLG